MSRSIRRSFNFILFAITLAVPAPPPAQDRSFFAGVELLASATSRTVSTTGEARCHAITNVNGLNPDGLALTIGVKTSF
jgi:hypothetical protein